MRRNLWFVGLSILLVSALASASAIQATSIPVRGHSTYGTGDATVVGSPTSGTFLGGSYTENTVCPSSEVDTPTTCFEFGYDFTFTFTPPGGATTLTLDFPTAVSGVQLDILTCDTTTSLNIPCGTITAPLDGTQGPDGGSGQKFVFTNLGQLTGQNVNVMFVDAFNSNDDSVSVPSFTSTYNTATTPEPASLALLGLGLLTLGGKLRRKPA